MRTGATGPASAFGCAFAKAVTFTVLSTAAVATWLPSAESVKAVMSVAESPSERGGTAGSFQKRTVPSSALLNAVCALGWISTASAGEPPRKTPAGLPSATVQKRTV